MINEGNILCNVWPAHVTGVVKEKLFNSHIKLKALKSQSCLFSGRPGPNDLKTVI